MDWESSARSARPGRKVVALAIVVLAVITTALIAKDDGSKNTVAPLVVTDRRATLPETDTDGDGLKDWEEVLLGTNPNLTDTDGDGVDDKTATEEIRKTMEERESAILAGIVSGFDGETEGLTKTEQLARALFEQAYNFSDANVTLDSSSANTVASLLKTGVLDDQALTVQQVTADGIVTADDSENSLRTYANSVASIIGGKSTAETNELVVFAEFGETKDPATLAKMEGVADSYELFAMQLAELPVPQTLLEKHLNFINAMLRTGGSIRLLSKISEDPVVAIVGLQAYAQYSEQMTLAFDAIRQKLIDAEVSFTDEDAGKIIVEEPRS